MRQFFFFSERAAWGVGGGVRCQTFSNVLFPCSDHERDWPPCKVVFIGLVTNTLNVRNNNNCSPIYRVIRRVRVTSCEILPRMLMTPASRSNQPITQRDDVLE